jgi:phage baseplate assembly protein V
MRSPQDAPTDPDQLIRFGTIASVDLGAARCVVTLDDAAATGPIRWFEARAGATRTWSPPTVGEQVMVLCAGGEIGAAVALRGIASDANPPAGNSLVENITFSDGAVLSYDPVAHTLAIILPTSAAITITAPSGISLAADVNIAGSISASGNIVAGTGATGSFSTPTGETVTVTSGIVVNIG